jgi:hypothetical protein
MTTGVRTLRLRFSAAIVGVIIMAVVGNKSFVNAQSGEIFSGSVMDQANHGPISNAEILVAQDQGIPEVLHTDSHGTFVVRVRPGTSTLRLSVSAGGYVPEVRTVSPARTGPEEFQLKLYSVRRKSPPAEGQSAPNSHGDANNRTNPTPTQTANCDNQGPCIGINNGVANIYVLGTPPPPIRNVDPDYVTNAIATLSVAPKGTTLRLDAAGESKDLESFVSQVQLLFQLSGWRAFKGSRSPSYTSTTILDSGVFVSHGEGISCFSKNTSAAFIAKRALEQIGYPCQGEYTPDYLERFAADFYVRIGAPTN